LPQQLKERVLGHAEGNPFYMEEIIRSLIDSEALARDEATGCWQVTRGGLTSPFQTACKGS